MKKKYVIFIIIIIFLIIIGLVISKSLKEERNLFLYTNQNKEVILWDKDNNKKTVLVSNFDLQKNNIINFRLSPNNKYIVFPTVLEENDTYCLSYKEINREEVKELSCNVSDFIVTDKYIYYLKDEILYRNNYDENEIVASNIASIYDFNKDYYLTINGSLYEITDNENKIASLVTAVLDEYRGKVVVTKKSSEEMLSNLVSALYVGDTKITDTMFSYHGNNKKGLYYASLSKDILNNIILDKGYKNVITNLSEAKTNSNYILYMIASDSCQYCQKLDNVLSEMVESYGFIYNYLDYPSLNASVKEEVNNKLTDGSSYPKLVVVKDGTVIDIFEGYADRSVIYDFLKENTDFLNYNIDDSEFIPYLESYIYKDKNSKISNGFFQNNISNDLLLAVLASADVETNLYSSLKLAIYETKDEQLIETDLNYINNSILGWLDENLFYKDEKTSKYYLFNISNKTINYIDNNILNYVYDTYLYYVKKDNNDYKIYNYNSGKNEMIGSCSNTNLALNNNRLYYINDGFLYSYDGKNTHNVTEASYVSQAGDLIYFASKNNLYYLNKNADKVLIDENILLSLGLVKLENK